MRKIYHNICVPGIAKCAVYCFPLLNNNNKKVFIKHNILSAETILNTHTCMHAHTQRYPHTQAY